MDKSKIRKILTSVLAVLLIFSMFSETAFALSGDGSHIGHTGGGSSVSGAYLVPSSNADHHVGFRFSWLTLGSDGYYSRKASLDVFYKGYNPNSSWGYHIKATVNGKTYRNFSKYEYKRYFDSMTIDREYYSTSTAYKYCNRTDIPVTLPADEDAMTTWGKKEANMNIILNKMVSGSTVANMKSTDFVFIEPIYRVKIENTNYCITVTEMGLIGCVVCSKTSTGNEGSGYGSGWVTIRRYTNRNWPDALKTDSAHAGISAGTTLSSATSFQNMVNKGYGLMVVWNTNPHLLTVYYATGTGDSSLKISSSYKLLSDFANYSSSYIRNSSDNFFTQNVYYDNTLTLMNGAGSGFKMTRDYYTFSKWQKNGTTSYFDGGSTHKASALNSAVATGNADVTFTAVWTPKPYKITYNLNGGKIGSSTTNPVQNYTYETDVYIGNYSSGATAYATPSRDGYDFGGWKYTGTTLGYWSNNAVYTNRYHKGQWEHGDITLYAQWSKKTYTVTYNANGGTGAPANQTKTYGVDLTLSSTKPTRDGYDFVSWNTKSDGSGTTYKSGAKYTANANLTLYAQWSKKTYTVTYNANGGTGAPSAQTKNHNVDLTLSSTKPTRDGYNFTGWNTKSDGKGTAYASGAKYTRNESLTLYAQWSKKTYTVTYNANGGSGAPASQTKTHGVDLTLASGTPTRTGYDFVSWNTKADGKGTTYKPGAKYTANANLTLFAQWKLKTYTVAYNANGGKNAPSSQTKTHNVDLTLSSTKPTQDGYDFTVWNTRSDGKGTAYASGAKYTRNESVTLYAQWSKKTYTVTYNANGGSGAPAAQTKTHGVDLTLSSTKPTRSGYDFIGWNTKSDGKGTAYASGGKYTKNESVTLYAQWKIKTYTVAYNANGGKNAPSSQTKTHNVDLTLSSTKPIRDGYDFTGWNTKSDGKGTAYASSAKYTKNESVTLYAQWKINTYTVTYNANGGTGAPGAQTKTYGKDLTLSSTKPTRTGYTFASWNTKSDGRGTTYASGGKYTGNADLTLYAIWTPITYSVKFNGNGATSGSMNNQSHTYDSSKTLTANAYKRAFTVTYNYNGNGSSNSTATANATFNGWATSASGSKAYTDKQNVKNLSSTQGATVDLYAKWTDASVTLPTPTRTGYVFNGWYTAASGGTKIGNGGAKYTPSANITLYAQWKPISFSVKFNGNGATSGAMNDQGFTFDKAQNLTANAFKRAFAVTYNYNGNGSANSTATANAAFNGWATSSTGKVAYTDKQSVKNLSSTQGAIINLYAKWTDGSVTLPMPTRTGYTFSGWYSSASGGTKIGAGGAKYTPNASITLYAQWSPITYTVKFNGNGNTSGSMSNQSHTYDTAKALTANAFKRAFTVTYNYNGNGKSNSSAVAAAVFSGWATSASGSKIYADKQSVKNLSSTQGATVNLFAKWADASVTLPTPTRTGYIFNGWFTASSGGTKIGNGGASYTPGKDITLYAQWSPITYTIKFNGNGATSGSMADLSMTYDVAKNLTDNAFKRTGYTFGGWNTRADGSGTKYTNKQSVKNLTAANGTTINLYAQWSPITYTVKFNGNGSTSGSMTNQSFTYDAAKALTANAFKRSFTVTFNYNGNGQSNGSAKANATFTGWATSASGNKVYADKQSVKNLSSTQGATVNLYAKWSDASVTLPTPTRTGYIFNGWFTSSSGGTKVGAGGASYTPSKDITLYAQWSPIMYTIRFNGNNATSGSMANMSMTYDVAKYLTDNAFKRTGYSFTGWNTAADGSGTKYTNKQSVKNLTATNGAVINLYAQWTPDSYTIKFNGNGPTSGSMSDLKMTYDVAKKLTANAFKRTGYTFKNWNTKSDGKGTSYADKQSVKNLPVLSGNTVTLYAQWTPISYTVKYNGNGASSGSMGDQKLTYDTAADLTANTFRKTGYVFGGWATSASGSRVYSDRQNVKNLSSENGAVITLYAVWTPITYTVKFNGNNSTSGSMSNLSMTYDVAKTLTVNAFKRTGYTFNGWNTAADGSGTKYSDKQSVKNLTATQGTTVNLYAQWIPIGYAVKFNGNGSTSGSMSNQSFVYDKAQDLSANAFKREFTITYNYNYNGAANSTAKASAAFSGWAISASGSKVYTDKQNVNNLSSTNGAVVDLYAKWTDRAVTLPVPARTGYVFDGWYTSASSGTKIGAGGGSYTPSKDITVYAHWTPITYSIKFNGNSSTSGSMSNLSMTYDTAKTLTANAFKRTGYTFNGWNTAADGSGTKYSDKQSVKNLTSTQGATVNLYAQWNPIGYSVRFNGNGATTGSMADQGFVYDKAQNLAANAFKREFTVTYNYNYAGKENTTAKATAAFGGWATSATGNAVYTDKQSVKNLSSVSGAVINIYAKWSDAKATLPAPTRTGYIFTGWYTSSTNGTKIGDGGGSYTTNKDVTVYAHWMPITYTVRFNGNHSTSGSMSDLAMTYDEAKNLTASAYVRTGYIFNGWNTAADGKGTAYADRQSVKNLTATDKATITLYAQWKPISYTIHFDGNGASSGSMANMTLFYDTAKNLTANAFVKNAAEFVKWNTNADGSGTDYSDMQSVKNLTTENGKIINLYAQWKTLRELSLEAITPNAAYRESTEVITSFYLVNKGDGVCLPTDNVSVVFKVYKDSTVIKTVTQNNVIVPGNEKNLLYFKWTVPTNLGSSKIYVSGEIVENGSSHGLIKNQYATCKYEISATPDTQYEISAPDGFTVPAALTSANAAKNWSEWTYENGAFKQVTYGIGISDAAVTVTPDAALMRQRSTAFGS